MPHLSPIIWFLLYVVVWASLLLSLISLEYNNPSLSQ